jgi:hypothetical protein
VLEKSIGGVTVVEPAASHMEKGSPQFLNVLRVVDVPVALGLVAPRELHVKGGSDALLEVTRKVFEAAGASEKLLVQ